MCQRRRRHHIPAYTNHESWHDLSSSRVCYMEKKVLRWVVCSETWLASDRRLHDSRWAVSCLLAIFSATLEMVIGQAVVSERTISLLLYWSTISPLTRFWYGSLFKTHLSAYWLLHSEKYIGFCIKVIRSNTPCVKMFITLSSSTGSNIKGHHVILV